MMATVVSCDVNEVTFGCHPSVGTHCQENKPVIRSLEFSALTGVVQWIEHGPVNQRVTGSISSLDHMPGLQDRSPVGDA